jgi:hypothetical protein
MNELDQEMAKYSESMKTFLPLERKMISLKKQGLSLQDVREQLGSDSSIIDYVPNTLYHGSQYCLDVINPRESTQGGSVVYATDNPMHALFFSIFRNSSQVRAHIDERIDENGNYQVDYIIDERYVGALDEVLNDKNVTIHICNGSDFIKPQGEQFINREWVSKNGIEIVPTDRITVNPKEVLEELHQKGLLHFNRYDKSKDWQTVIDMLSMNYPFGLGTERAINDPQEFENLYDDYISLHFPEQFEFSKKFREYARSVMNGEGDMDSKLRTISATGRSLLNGREPNMDLINEKFGSDSLTEGENKQR